MRWGTGRSPGPANQLDRVCCCPRGVPGGSPSVLFCLSGQAFRGPWDGLSSSVTLAKAVLPDMGQGTHTRAPVHAGACVARGATR